MKHISQLLCDNFVNKEIKITVLNGNSEILSFNKNSNFFRDSVVGLQLRKSDFNENIFFIKPMYLNKNSDVLKKNVEFLNNCMLYDKLTSDESFKSYMSRLISTMSDYENNISENKDNIEDSDVLSYIRLDKFKSFDVEYRNYGKNNSKTEPFKLSFDNCLVIELDNRSFTKGD